MNCTQGQQTFIFWLSFDLYINSEVHWVQKYKFCTQSVCGKYSLYNLLIYILNCSITNLQCCNVILSHYNIFVSSVSGILHCSHNANGLALSVALSQSNCDCWTIWDNTRLQSQIWVLPDTVFPTLPRLSEQDLARTWHSPCGQSAYLVESRHTPTDMTDSNCLVPETVGSFLL